MCHGRGSEALGVHHGGAPLAVEVARDPEVRHRHLRTLGVFFGAVVRICWHCRVCRGFEHTSFGRIQSRANATMRLATTWRMDWGKACHLVTVIQTQVWSPIRADLASKMVFGPSVQSLVCRPSPLSSSHFICLRMGWGRQKQPVFISWELFIINRGLLNLGKGDIFWLKMLRAPFVFSFNLAVQFLGNMAKNLLLYASRTPHPYSTADKQHLLQHPLTPPSLLKPEAFLFFFLLLPKMAFWGGLGFSPPHFG